MHASVAALLRFTCKLIHEGLPHYASMSLTVLRHCACVVNE